MAGVHRRRDRRTLAGDARSVAARRAAGTTRRRGRRDRAGALRRGALARARARRHGVARDRHAPRHPACDRGNTIVPLAWKGIPANTVSVAVVVRDPDAAGGFVHWIVLGLPPADGSLPPVPVTARQLANSAGQPLWKGPCPPAGPLHHYQFTVYALDKDVRTLDEIAGATIGQGTLVGVYRR